MKSRTSRARKPRARAGAARLARARPSTAKARPGRGSRSAVSAKGPLKVPSEIPTLSRWLADDPKPRLAELRVTIEKAGKERWARLMDPVRIALAWAWDENADVFWKLLSRWLSAESPRLRQVAAGAIPLANERVHAKGVQVLKRLAFDAAPEVRLTAIDVLAEDVDRHLELVKKWSRDEDPRVRAIVARHLHLTCEPRKVFPLLETLALDPEPDVHWTAASTLYDLSAADPKGALDSAKKMAASRDQDVRSAAALCFFEHVFADSFDHSFLLMRQWVRSGDASLRWTLAHSLRFARPNARTLQVLRALFEDRDPEIRRRVVWQLGELLKKLEDRRQAAELLRRALKDSAKRVRDMAEESERVLGVDLASIPPPPLDGEPGAEAVEAPWGPVGTEEPSPEDEAQGGADEDDDL